MLVKQQLTQMSSKFTEKASAGVPALHLSVSWSAFYCGMRLHCTVSIVLQCMVTVLHLVNVY